jgi:hypothetical protein
MRIVAFTLIVGSISIAGAALAAFVHKPGTSAWTEPAGVAGSSHAEVLTNADYYGLQILKLWQYGHAPCVLGVEESTLSAQGLVALDPLKMCEPTGGEQWKQVDVGAGNYVTGIATCTAKDKDDPVIHGVELFAAKIAAGGKLSASESRGKLEFLECKKWQPKRACPAGSVATGVRAYWSDAEHGLVGVALRCNAIESRGK